MFAIDARLGRGNRGEPCTSGYPSNKVRRGTERADCVPSLKLFLEDGYFDLTRGADKKILIKAGDNGEGIIGMVYE